MGTRITFRKRLNEQLLLAGFFAAFGILLLISTTYGSNHNAIANVLFAYGAIFVLAISGVLVYSSVVRR